MPPPKELLAGVGRTFGRSVTDSLSAFAARRQPYMVRSNYVHELKSALTFPLAAALAEGTFTGVVASKYFQAGPLLIAVITAAPMFGNILALLWAELAETRPKVRFINALQVGVVIAMAAVGLTYFIADNTVAGWTFAALIIIARVLASGIVTLRSAVWRLNYPRALRGQIISRINGVYNTVLAGMVLVSALALDGNPGLYAIIYPVVAVVSLFGVVQFSRVRVRGEAGLLRRIHLAPAGPSEMSSVGMLDGDQLGYGRAERGPTVSRIRSVLRRGLLRRVYGCLPVRVQRRIRDSAAGRLAVRVADAFALLRSDKMFREYQWWQLLIGSSFMMMFPSLIYMVSTEMTDRRTQYVLAVIVLQFIPMVTGVIFLQVWAPLFDRTDIFTFRVWNSVVSASSHALILAGAVTGQLWLIAVGTFTVGVSMGGGQLAWQLGQNAFATKENVGTYMGLHVMLTGLRGMFAPFLGVGIYHFLSSVIGPIGGVPGGRWLFLGPLLLSGIAVFGYISMSRRYRGLTREGDDA